MSNLLRYEAYVKTAEAHMEAENWRAAAKEYYSAYCEHPSKWTKGHNAEREELLELSESAWSKHRAIFEVGQTARIPSGLGGVFDGKIIEIADDRIYILVNNRQSDFHGRRVGASYREAVIFK